MTNFAISQALVGMAIVFDVASFQFKDREKLLICFVAASGLLSLHFFVLGQNVGGVLYMLTLLRFITAYFSKSSVWLLVFLATSVGAFFFTYQSIYSVFAFLGALASTYGAFQREDLRLRIFMFAGTVCWLIFNLVIFSPVAVARQSLFALSNLVGLWRFYRRPGQVVVVE